MAAGALVLLFVMAVPAGAHDADEVGPSNYVSRVENIVDASGASAKPKGLEVRAVAHGVLELRNDTGEGVVVGGQAGEPYLRIEPGTVWTWHDDRVHWPAATAPPQVKVDPSREVRVLNWRVPLSVGGDELAVLGSVTWVPPPAWPPWVLLAAAVTVAPLLRRHSVTRGAAVGMATCAAFVLVRGVDLLALSGAALPLLTALLALATAFHVWRRADRGLVLAAGGLVLVLATFPDALAVLGSSQLVTRLPDALARLCAAFSLVAAVPAGVAGVQAALRRRQARTPAPTATTPTAAATGRTGVPPPSSSEAG